MDSAQQGPQGLQPALVVRQQVVTLTQSRPFTTLTALVTLGNGGGTTLNTEPTSTLVTTATTQTPALSSTSDASTASLSVTPTSNLTQDQIGAIVGSVVGFVVLFLCFCLCMRMRRRPRKRRRHHREWGDDGSTTISQSEARRIHHERMRQHAQWQYQQQLAARRGEKVMMGIPPPARFAPSRRESGVHYVHTVYPQIRGVSRFP